MVSNFNRRQVFQNFTTTENRIYEYCLNIPRDGFNGIWLEMQLLK